MANNWNYKISTREHQIMEDPLPPLDYATSVVHLNEKSRIQKIKDRISSMNVKDFSRLTVKTVLVALPLIAALYLVTEVQKKQSLNSKAGANTAKLFFQVGQANLPPESDFQLLAFTDGPVGFVKTEVNFDPSLVKLVSEVDITASPLKRVVKVTSMTEANTTGKIEIILGLEPTSLASAPTGNMQLAKFRLGSNTQTTNSRTTLSINSGNSQVVNTDTTIFTITPTNTNLTLNYVAATPTATSQASTPTPVATSTAVATATPSSSSAPTVNITSPSDGSTLDGKGRTSISANASDSSGIAKIELYLDDAIFKTCNNSTSCSEGFKSSTLSVGSHTIKVVAINRIGLLSSQSVTVIRQ